MTTPTPDPARLLTLADAIARIDDARSRIGRMCSEMRPPKMSIPAQPGHDGALVIDDTLRTVAYMLSERSAPCRWDQDEDGNWPTACKSVWDSNGYHPSEHNILWCPFCGHPVEAVPFVEGESDG